MHRSTTTTNPIDVDWSHTTPLAQRQSAGLIILRSADQNPQEVFYHLLVLEKQVVKLDIKRSLVTGMAQRLARGAHNSEVTRSKRVAGIQFITSHRCIKALEQQTKPAWRRGRARGS